MIGRVQPRVGSAEHHLSDVVETVVDVISRLGRRNLALNPAGRHDRLADPIETVEGVKHGHGVRTCVRAEDDDPVVALWDERGPFEVGEGAVDGVVRCFFGEKSRRAWPWARAGAGVEVEDFERGIVLDAYCVGRVRRSSRDMVFLDVRRRGSVMDGDGGPLSTSTRLTTPRRMAPSLTSVSAERGNMGCLLISE
jgi:hypothetical protein